MKTLVSFLAFMPLLLRDQMRSQVSKDSSGGGESGWEQPSENVHFDCLIISTQRKELRLPLLEVSFSTESSGDRRSLSCKIEAIESLSPHPLAPNVLSPDLIWVLSKPQESPNAWSGTKTAVLGPKHRLHESPQSACATKGHAGHLNAQRHAVRFQLHDSLEKARGWRR